MTTDAMTLPALTPDQRNQARDLVRTYLGGPYHEFMGLMLPHFNERWHLVPLSAMRSGTADGRRATPPWPNPPYADPTGAAAARGQLPTQDGEPCVRRWYDDYYAITREEVDALLLSRMPAHLAKALLDCVVNYRKGAVEAHAEKVRREERTVRERVTEGLGMLCQAVYGPRWDGGADAEGEFATSTV